MRFALVTLLLPLALLEPPLALHAEEAPKPSPSSETSSPASSRRSLHAEEAPKPSPSSETSSPASSRRSLHAEEAPKLSINAAMKLAVERNPNLSDSELAVVLAELAAHRARLDRLAASVDVSAGENATFTWTSGTPLDEQDLAGNSLNYGMSATLSFPVFAGGAISGQIKRSDVDVKLRKLDHSLVVRDLLRAVYQAYWTAHGYDLQQDAAREALSQSREALSIIQAKLDSGLGAPLELTRFKVDVLSQEQRLADLELMSYNTRQTLLKLLYLDGDKVILTDAARDVKPGNWPDVPAPLLERAHKSRLELTLLELSRKGATHDRLIAQSAFFPSVSVDLTADSGASPYWYDKESRDNAELGPSVDVSAGVNLQWNLFNLWTTTYQVSRVDVAIKQLEAQYEAQRALIDEEVKKAHQQLMTLERRAPGVREQLELARENLNIIQTLYSQGSSSILDLFEAQGAYRTALVQEAIFRVDLTIAEYELRWTLGEDFGAR